MKPRPKRPDLVKAKIAQERNNLAEFLFELVFKTGELESDEDGENGNNDSVN